MALAGTLAVEVPLYAVLLPRRAPVTAARAVAIGVLVNVVSHPLLWFGLQPVGRWAGAPTLAAVVVAELVVWLLEAAAVRVLAGVDVRWALAVTAVANAASLGAGLVLVLVG